MDGESIGARSRYIFTDIDDDHTIRATFEWVGDSDEPDEKPDPKPEPDDSTDDTDDEDSGSSGVADPNDTGVANWLNTTEHVRYLKGYDTGMFMPERLYHPCRSDCHCKPDAVPCSGSGIFGQQHVLSEAIC